MERERKTKIIAIIALCISLVGLGIGFSAFSSSLSIAGTATVGASSWNVIFGNLAAGVPTGQATELTAPTINGSDTSIGTYSVSFENPGDSITYTFDVINGGTFNAVLSTFAMPTPTCEGTGDNATNDATNVCANLSYTLTYTEGGTEVAQNDVLTAGQTRNMTLTLAYNDLIEPENLPEAQVSVSNLGITLLYAQE